MTIKIFLLLRYNLTVIKNTLVFTIETSLSLSSFFFLFLIHGNDMTLDEVYPF